MGSLKKDVHIRVSTQCHQSVVVLINIINCSEYENVSPELHSIYNAGFMGLFVGIVYGGFLGSKKAYMTFMERNQATTFETHLDAKKKLQERVTLGFAKDGWKLGWRLGVFAFMYMGVSTCMSVYRNKYSIFDYITAGTVTGAVYKWNVSYSY